MVKDAPLLKEERRIITKNEFYMILENIKPKIYVPTVFLAYFCGLKPSEILNLKKEDFDIEKGLIILKDRHIPFPRSFLRYLEHIPINRDIRSLQFAFKKVVKKLGLKCYFRDLRFSFMINSLYEGKTLQYVNYISGTSMFHKNLNMKRFFREVNAEDKLKIFKRDNYSCRKCGSKDNLEADHIIPISKGGLNNIFNLQTLCKECNLKKNNN